MIIDPQESQLIHKTPAHELVIDKFISSINCIDVESDSDYFAKLCQNGCPNYSRKYSCPPYSPAFDKFVSEKKRLSVICYRIILAQYAPLNIYQSIRASNSVLKSIIDRELISYRDKGFIIAGSGSCRACKPCAAKIKQGCKKPERRIYSLEALGVNVDDLVWKCFGFHLQWYSRGNVPPAYTCVVGGILE